MWLQRHPSNSAMFLDSIASLKRKVIVVYKSLLFNSSLTGYKAEMYIYCGRPYLALIETVWHLSLAARRASLAVLKCSSL